MQALLPLLHRRFPFVPAPPPLVLTNFALLGASKLVAMLADPYGADVADIACFYLYKGQCNWALARLVGRRLAFQASNNEIWLATGEIVRPSIPHFCAG